MLKNFHPLLSGELLSAIDSLEPGRWLTVANTLYPGIAIGPSMLTVGEASVEDASTAILSVMALADIGDDPPLAFLDDDPGANELPDVVFAVLGIAADAELRRIGMSFLPPEKFTRLASQSSLSVQTRGGGAPHAFLFRKGDQTGNDNHAWPRWGSR